MYPTMNYPVALGGLMEHRASHSCLNNSLEPSRSYLQPADNRSRSPAVIQIRPQNGLLTAGSQYPVGIIPLGPLLPVALPPQHQHPQQAQPLQVAHPLQPQPQQHPQLLPCLEREPDDLIRMQEQFIISCKFPLRKMPSFEEITFQEYHKSTYFHHRRKRSPEESPPPALERSGSRGGGRKNRSSRQHQRSVSRSPPPAAVGGCHRTGASWRSGSPPPTSSRRRRQQSTTTVGDLDYSPTSLSWRRDRTRSRSPRRQSNAPNSPPLSREFSTSPRSNKSPTKTIGNPNKQTE